ncbi:hypothetical protein FACS1894190_16780 [Spirochaetia bacterium]|nr:hypothetical protein FACS1894190_16780 [Spirochaetia bacterium]
MGFLYKILETITPFLGYKKIFSLESEEIKAYSQKHNLDLPVPPPSSISRNFNVTKHTMHLRPCYQITPHNVQNIVTKVVMFIHGGGFIFGIHPVHWLAIRDILKKTSLPVWAPDYPLLPNAGLKEMTLMLYETYTTIKQTYPAAEIIMIGDSAGADLSITLCQYLKTETQLPLPHRLILVSPGQASETDPQIISEIKKIQKNDVMLSINLLKTMPKLFNMDFDPNNYYCAPFNSNFTGFPDTYVFSGTHDIFFPQVKRLVLRLQSYGIKTEFIEGKDMLHVWPYMPVVPECKKELARIIDIINLP